MKTILFLILKHLVMTIQIYILEKQFAFVFTSIISYPRNSFQTPPINKNAEIIDP